MNAQIIRFSIGPGQSGALYGWLAGATRDLIGHSRPAFPGSKSARPCCAR